MNKTHRRMSWAALLAAGLLTSPGAIAQRAVPEDGRPPSKSETPKAGKPDQGGPKSDAAGKTDGAKPAAPPHKLTKGGDLETAAQRAKKLRDLYAELAAAPSADVARRAAAQIEKLWFRSESDTALALMQRAEAAIGAERFDLALNLLNAAVEFAPDHAEVWNRRAYAHYLSGDIKRAVGDLRRVLALDPNHFKALEALGQIMKELGNKPAALAALRSLQAVHPHAGVEQAVKELTTEVEGQPL
jgi:tetratricopeptide (TPR) repeat protein